MTERIKNFIYDVSDILLALLIIGCMIFVISWKLSDVIDFSMPSSNLEASTITIPKETPDKVIDIDDETDIIVLDPIVGGSTGEASVENNIEIPVDADPLPEAPTNPSHETSTDIIVEIPKGTIGSGIAGILKEKGLIENTSDFIARVEELGLAPKLRFGTFTINTSNSLDEIIHIITGTR